LSGNDGERIGQLEKLTIVDLQLVLLGSLLPDEPNNAALKTQQHAY